MVSLKEQAKQYEPKTTLNIADLDKIPLNLDVKTGQGKTKEGEEFKYLFAEIDKKEYRIAGTILGGIKALIKKMPNLEFVSVIKTGMGRDTRYQVIPWVDQ